MFQIWTGLNQMYSSSKKVRVDYCSNSASALLCFSVVGHFPFQTFYTDSIELFLIIKTPIANDILFVFDVVLETGWILANESLNSII